MYDFQDTATTIDDGQLAQALAQGYFSIYYVDMETGMFTEYNRGIDNDRMLPRRCGRDFFADSVRTIRNLVMPEDQERLSTLLSRENVKKELLEGSILTTRYRRMIRGVPRYVSLRFLKLPDDPGHFLIGLTDIDRSVRKEQEYEAQKRESQRFSRIAQTLATDYFTIYYINTTTNEFIEFQGADQGRKLDRKLWKEDFFQWARKRISHSVFGSYRTKALAAYDRDAIMKTLRTEKIYSTSYRRMVDGKTQYVNVKAFRMIDEGDNHIVIGLSNIGERIKREEEFALIQEMALRDPMTGVKNKRAYGQAEQRLNDDIGSGQAESFSVVVCDINGLKIVNDTLGHKAGDEYIKEASSEICGIFSHSPVFRVGGDEFAILLSGPDHKARQKLMSDLAAVNERNLAAGKVTIASGISDFDPAVDQNVAAVFNRADSAMYRNKKNMKGIS